MKRETLYASLAGIASFCLIAYGSFWYFSRAERTVDPAVEERVAPEAVAVELPAAPVNASPAAAEPRWPAPAADGVNAQTGAPQAPPPSNVALPSAVGTNATEDDEQEDEGRPRFRERRHTPPPRGGWYKYNREQRRQRQLAEED